MKLIDMTGDRFGRLIVVSRSSISNQNGDARWLCKCDCGNEVVVSRTHLKNGNVRSCKCLRSEMLDKIKSDRMKKVGTGVYFVWRSMMNRCYNQNTINYKHYGERGIKVCQRWHTFELFKQDIGIRPKFHTLERSDVNGIYEPSNCKWATSQQQSRNKRDNRIFVYDGNKYIMTDLAKHLNIPLSTFTSRLKRGWSIEKIAAKSREMLEWNSK